MYIDYIYSHVVCSCCLISSLPLCFTPTMGAMPPSTHPTLLEPCATKVQVSECVHGITRRLYCNYTPFLLNPSYPFSRADCTPLIRAAIRFMDFQTSVQGVQSSPKRMGI